MDIISVDTVFQTGPQMRRDKDKRKESEIGKFKKK